MTSEIRPRRSPRLNKEYVSSSDESDSVMYDSTEDVVDNMEPYSNYIKVFDDRIDFFTRLSKAFIFIPVLYSFLNGLYFHSAVSASMLIGNYYPNFSICDINVGNMSYHIGFYTYAVSQILITTSDNIYLILFPELVVQYGYLVYMILYLRNDHRYAHFKMFMNFFICFSKCIVIYYLTNKPAI